VAVRPSTRHHCWRRVDPRAAARNSRQQVRLEQLPPLFLFLAGGDNTVTCKTIKTQHRQVILVFISFVFQIFFGFFLFKKICPVSLPPLQIGHLLLLSVADPPWRTQRRG
jgi:hypothetical protein